MPRIIRSALGRVTVNASHRTRGGATQVSPVYATSFAVTVAPSSGNVGASTTVTYTPVGGTWAPGEALTPTLLNLSGTFSQPTTLSPNSGTTTPVTTTLVTTGSPGTGTVNAASAIGTAASSVATITATAAAAGFGGWPILFTGTVGTLPTGDAKITSNGISPTLSGFSLDGAGALIMAGTADYTGGSLDAPGYLSNGNFDVTFAAGTPNRVMDIVGFNAAGNQLAFLFFSDGTVGFFRTVGGFATPSASVVPSNATSIGINFTGSVYTVRANGANTAASWTDSSAPGPWKMTIRNDTVAHGTGVKITTVNSTQPSNESLTIDSITSQVSGVPFAATGTYAIVTPTALDYSTDGGATWTAAVSPTIGSGVYSLSATVTGAGTLIVRDHNHTTVTATSNFFTVSIPPGSDGYANGIYYPANAYTSRQGGYSVPMVSGFARFASNGPQRWYLTGTDAGAFYLGGRNLSLLLAGQGAYNVPQSIFSLTVNVTDGTVVYSQAVTVHNSAGAAAYFGGNVILDSSVSGGYNGFADTQSCLNENTLQGIGAGGLSFADTSGKLTVGGYNGWICTTPAAEPVSAHYGQVTTAVATVGGIAFSAPFWLAQEQPAYIALQPAGASIYTFLQPGDVVGQLAAYSDAGIQTGANGYVLVSSDGTIAMASTGQIVVAAGATLTAGVKSLTVQITSGNWLVTTKVIAYTVVSGTLLTSTNMTMTVNPALDNWQTAQSIGTPSVSGMSAGMTWEISNPDDCYDEFNNHLPMRLFGINSSTGAVTGGGGFQVQQLPATSPNTMPGSSRQFSRPPHQITITATNGSVRCRRTFSVPVAWKSGPTLWVGQGMAAAHPGVGYERISHLAGIFANANNPILPSGYAGALILIQPNADRDYYALHGVTNSSLGETLDTDNSLRYSWRGPVCIRAANTTGARPRLGGLEGSTYGGCSIDHKSYITANVGDFIIDGFEVSFVQDWSTPSNFSITGVSGLRKDADLWGDYYVLNCNIHDCNNDIESGNGPYWTVVDRCVLTNFGTEYVGSGATHGLYCGACTFDSFTNNLVYHGTNGHGLKSRAKSGLIQGNRIFDGERGSMSNQIDIPDQGKYTIDSNVLQKGPNCQNPYIIQYGEEPTAQLDQMLYRDNTVTISNNTFMAMGPDGNHSNGIVCASMGGCTSAIDGSGTTITMTNNSYYLTQPGHQQKANNPYAFSTPTSFTETGATILTTLPVISMTDPVAGFTPAARAGWLLAVYDNADTYNNFFFVQIDPGQDIPLTVSHLAGTGTVIANCVGYGAPQWANDGNTAMVNPFATGANWSISQAPQWNGSTPWAPAGRYVINASTGALSVGTAAPAAGVTDFVKIRVVSTMAGAVGVTCDYRFSITGT